MMNLLAYDQVIDQIVFVLGAICIILGITLAIGLTGKDMLMLLGSNKAAT